MKQEMKEEILGDLKRIKDENGEITSLLYERLGTYPLILVKELFGNFKTAIETAENYFFDKEVLKVVKKKDVIDIADICDLVDASPKKIRFSIARLIKDGYGLNVKNNKKIYFDKDPKHRKVKKPYTVSLNVPEKVITFAVLGDTHLCSDNEALEELKFFYETARNVFGVTDFFHCGDLVAGMNMFRGQESEVKGWGGDKQVDYLVENYPKIDKCKTYFITGNHDFSFYKNSGIDIGKVISKQRNDLIYVGPYTRTLNYKSLKIMLHHIDKVPSAVIGKPLQDVISKMPPNEKPDFLFCGHLHQSAYLKYRDVHSFLVGCFEKSNEWLKRKILHPTIGGYIVQVGIDNGNIRMISPTFIDCEK